MNGSSSVITRNRVFGMLNNVQDSVPETTMARYLYADSMLLNDLTTPSSKKFTASKTLKNVRALIDCLKEYGDLVSIWAGNPSRKLVSLLRGGFKSIFERAIEKNYIGALVAITEPIRAYLGFICTYEDREDLLWKPWAVDDLTHITCRNLLAFCDEVHRLDAKDLPSLNLPSPADFGSETIILTNFVERNFNRVHKKLDSRLMSEFQMKAAQERTSHSKLKKAAEQNQILNWISIDAIDFKDTYERMTAIYTGDGLKRLQNKPLYQQWQENTNSQILWVTGLPGIGKTVLSSVCIQFLRAKISLDSAVIFAYGNYQRQTSATDIAKSFISQILRIKQHKKLHDFLPEAVEIHNNHMKDAKDPDIQTLTTLLRAVLPGLNKVFFILDALDECVERDSLVHFLREICQNSPHLIKVLVTSRPGEEVTAAFNHEHDLAIPMSADEEMFADIARYAAVNNVEQSLARPLESLEQLYATMFSRLQDSFDHEHIRKTFLWASYKEGPLNASGFLEAVGVEEISRFDQLPGASSGLLNIGFNGDVKLAHPTLIEFLNSDKVVPGLRLSRRVAHVELAECCLRNLISYASTLENLSWGQITFSQYAAKYWPIHVRKAAPIDSELAEHITSLISQKSKTLAFTLDGFSKMRMKKDQDLRIANKLTTISIDQVSICSSRTFAIYFDLGSVVDFPKDEYCPLYDVGTSQKVKSNLLLFFSATASLSAYQQLVREGMYTTFRELAFNIVVELGRKDILQYLLSENVLPVKDVGGNALLTAAMNGNGSMMRLLIEAGAEITHQPQEMKQTILHMELVLNNPALVRWLLEKVSQDTLSAFLKAQDEDGDSPLHLAVIYKSYAVVEYLLGLGAEINVRNWHKQTPLSHALRLRDKAMVKILLSGGSDTYDIPITVWRDFFENSNGASTESRWPKTDILEISEGEQGAIAIEQVPDLGFIQLRENHKGRKLFSATASMPGLDPSVNIFSDFEYGESLEWLENLMTFDYWLWSGLRIDKTQVIQKHDQLFMTPLDLQDMKQSLINGDLRLTFYIAYYSISSMFGGFFVDGLSLSFQEMEERRSRRNVHRIAWTMCYTDKTVRTVRFFSETNEGWIPSHGIDFVTRFLHLIVQDWREIFLRAGKHLTWQHDNILDARGEQGSLIHNLLRDAQSWALLRKHMEIHLDTIMRLVNIYDANPFLRDEANEEQPKDTWRRVYSFEDLVQEAKGLKKFLEDGISRLDDRTNELIGLEFNLVSITEAHKSTTMASSMKRLSWITFILLPPMFVASLFGMNVNILEENPTWVWYLAFSLSFSALVLLVWLMFKYNEYEDKIEHVFNRIKENLSGLGRKNSKEEDVPFSPTVDAERRKTWPSGLLVVPGMEHKRAFAAESERRARSQDLLKGLAFRRGARSTSRRAESRHEQT